MPRLTARSAALAVISIVLFTLYIHMSRESGLSGYEPADELLEASHNNAASRKEESMRKPVKSGSSSRKTAVVVASQASENATWLQNNFPRWEMFLYRVDDPKAELTVPENKGRREHGISDVRIRLVLDSTVC